MKVDFALCQKYRTIAVGLSGGRDSVVLLHLLLSKKDVLNITVRAICVEHGIRECSKSESESVYKLCEKLGVECRVYHVDCISYAKENKLTVEQSARELRYQCFESAMKDGFCEVIATAHHLSDNTETVLMRIFRGTGVKGLRGIAKERTGYIRPILHSTREEIDQYVQEHGLEYFEDETNTDLGYTRNYIRHVVVKDIKERYPSVDESILRLSKLANADEEYFTDLVKEKLLVLGKGVYGVSLADVKYYAVFSRLVRSAFYSLGVSVDVEDRHVELIKNLLNGENGDSLDMPYGVTVALEYEKIVFYKKDRVKDQEIPFLSTDTDIDLGVGYKIRCVDGLQKGGLCIDYDKACGSVFRYRREGDFFKRFGGGTKSLGDYFTDIKLAKRLRDKVVVLARGSEILAVLGVEISDSVKIDKDTKTIVCLTEK